LDFNIVLPGMNAGRNRCCLFAPNYETAIAKACIRITVVFNPVGVSGAICRNNRDETIDRYYNKREKGEAGAM